MDGGDFFLRLRARAVWVREGWMVGVGQSSRRQNARGIAEEQRVARPHLPSFLRRRHRQSRSLTTSTNLQRCRSTHSIDVMSNDERCEISPAFNMTAFNMTAFNMTAFNMTAFNMNIYSRYWFTW